MSAYYNEIDPFAAAWLRNLIAAGHIAPGEVDERSICDVDPSELRGFTQHHYFAGIGGWSLALRLAGWPDDRPVGTGSCPCQPLSSAGKQEGHVDERHLWPAFFDHIAELRFAEVFGEQVASPLGREWFAAVRTDLEGLGYAVGGGDLPAAGVGAPHIRQRIIWGATRYLADASVAGRRAQQERPAGADWRQAAQSRRLCDARGLAYSDSERRESGAISDYRQGSTGPGHDFDRCGETGVALGNALHAQRRSQGVDGEYGNNRQDQGRSKTCGDARAPDAIYHPWSEILWLPCRDGKARPTQPGIFPLAHGVSNRVGMLRGYGNAIVPQKCAAFITAFEEAVMECAP